jgi:hypothetical protein
MSFSGEHARGGYPVLDGSKVMEPRFFEDPYDRSFALRKLGISPGSMWNHRELTKEERETVQRKAAAREAVAAKREAAAAKLEAVIAKNKLDSYRHTYTPHSRPPSAWYGKQKAVTREDPYMTRHDQAKWDEVCALVEREYPGALAKTHRDYQTEL